MAHPELVPIAEAHLSTVEAIRYAARQGLFTAAQAEMLIDRVRAHVTAVPPPAPQPLPSAAVPLAGNGQG